MGEPVGLIEITPWAERPVGGRPIIERVAAALRAAGADPCYVVGAGGGLPPGVTPLESWQALRLPPGGLVLACSGDAPFLTGEVLARLAEAQRVSGAAAVLPCSPPLPPSGGALFAAWNGPLAEADVACLSADAQPLAGSLRETLDALRRRGCELRSVVVADPDALLAVRDGMSAALAEATDRARQITRLLAAGVRLVDPATCYVDARAQVAPGVEILPFTVLTGPCVVAEGCRLGPGTLVSASRLGPGTLVWYSVVEGSELGPGCEVGPYAHLRPDTRLAEGVRVGNFVEVKHCDIGARSKLPHHCYLGETRVGSDVNIGAGAVVVTWDGVKKRRSAIGDRVILGCNSNLVAPAQVADDAFVAAGSTVVEDVPSGALAVGRGRQVNLPGWVWRHRERRPEG